MNLLVPRPAQAATLGLAFALATTSLACRPENDVEPGAPVLKKLIIAQVTPFGPFGTSILPTTGDCPPSAVEGMACMPGPGMDVFCRQAASSNWCDCVAADPNDPSLGTIWACPAFANVGSVFAVFDRLLDTTPFTNPEDDTPMAIGNAATVMTAAGDVPALADYSTNGNEPGLIFPVYGPFFGSLRNEGPTVGVAPTPAFPSGSAITVSLNSMVLQAKDGQTGFTGEGLLQDGVISFTTAPFAAAISGPDPMNAADPVSATIVFTNFVDPETIADHVTVTAGGNAVPVTIGSGTGAHFSVTPDAGMWPAGATVEITVDAATASLAGETLGTAVTFTFMAP